MPLLDLIWVMLVFFVFTAWICAIIGIVADVFLSADLNGAAKAGWVLVVIAFPWLGVAVYLMARGGGLPARYREALTPRSWSRGFVDPRTFTPAKVD
ncbi:MAG: PLDc N-terminal domain-containing protein [Acidimicrobiia bacterium]|nr:PLDc N-terminal domain-containing protein [Acidimicrobiia bacterium]